MTTAATVGLVRLPKAKMFAVGHFDSLLGAIAATEDALELDPSAVEMIDRTIIDLSRSQLEYRRFTDRLEGDPEALLFVSFSADDEAEVRDKLDKLASAWRAPRPRLPHAARRDRGRPGRADQGPQGRASGC